MQVMQEQLTARPSGRPAEVQNRNVQGPTSAVEHKDVRERPPGDFFELNKKLPGVE